jgi:hypothetical protein
MYTTLFFLPIGINDGEHVNIRETGLPSKPEKLKWSQWNKFTDQSITPYPLKHKNKEPNITSYRTGTASTHLVKFTFYQLKILNNGKEVIIPAHSLSSGASIIYTLPIIITIISIVLSMGITLQHYKKYKVSSFA